MPRVPKNLVRPTLALLPRIVDQLSFLYLDLVRVERDDNGVHAVIDHPERGLERVYLPTASIAAVLLGPGTSITQPAATQLLRDGASLLLTGSGAVRCYGAITHDDLTTRWLHAQATSWADPRQREDVARRLYTRRFHDPALAAGKTITQLRGMEGQRVKAAYRRYAQLHGVRFRREYRPDDFASGDPVNQALTSAHQALYGVVHATVLALGMSPALGFIHSGTQRAYVYDIADLYKLEIAVPLAFEVASAFNPEREVRLRFRENYRMLKLARRIVSDIQTTLDPQVPPLADESDDVALVHLWDPALGALPAGLNYGDLT
jgi:CRISPR-associated protein Cas1